MLHFGYYYFRNAKIYAKILEWVYVERDAKYPKN